MTRMSRRTLLQRFRKTLPSRPRLTALTILLNLLLFSLLALAAFQSIRALQTLPPKPSLIVENILGTSPVYQLSPLQHDVRNLTRTLFRAYLRDCPGRDEYIPEARACSDWFDVGLTMLDSIDTLLLMNLDEEYQQVRAWAHKYLKFDLKDEPVSLFEIVIRVVGGLNSAYVITGDRLWLDKNVELVDMVLPAFRLSKSGCPPQTVYIGRNTWMLNKASYSSFSNPAEAGTMQLEFRTLSALTGNRKYARAVDACIKSMIDNIPSKGLVGISFDLDRTRYPLSRIGIGGAVDSFYEMMIKTWIAFGQSESYLRNAYVRTVEAVFAQLGVITNGYHIITECSGRGKICRSTMDHLACFFPGTLALAAQHGLGGGLHGKNDSDYMPRARRLTRSCYAMTRGPFGLAPEVTDFSVNPPQFFRHDAMSMLRPEVVEALFYMDKLDPEAGRMYKKWGESMWHSIRENAQVDGREDGIVTTTSHLFADSKQFLKHGGKLHSFVLAETVKYFFLLFDERAPFEGPFPLDKWVYNTEAHPVPIRSSVWR